MTSDQTKINLNLALININNSGSQTKSNLFSFGSNFSNVLDDIPKYKFNSAKANFCLQNNLYDILLNNEAFTRKCPTKFSINDKLFAFVYPNDYTTYSITISGAFSRRKNTADNFINKEQNEKGRIYYPSVGLFFCGKYVNVSLGKEKHTKKCLPDSYMCKNCVDINKKKYSIRNNYLINIKGRIAKINKGCYHCFGNFLYENRIRECITNFQCEACILLQKEYMK